MQRNRAFTIIELLVVVSIIALLVGILLPAIGKAREQAKLTQSQGNMKNLGTAAVTYAAEYGDRQLTYCVDNLSTYGAQGASVTNYLAQHSNQPHPSVIFGGGSAAGGLWGYWMPGTPNVPNNPGNYFAIVPADYDSATKFGSFRILQARNFNTYLGGRFFDPVFFAPKDSAVIGACEKLFDRPEEFPDTGNVNGNPMWGSYCFSPAAMVSPDVLGKNVNGTYYTSPWSMAAGYRSPAMSQAAFPDLKTHIIEHHWLQNRRKICNPAFGTSGAYDGCQPYYYNNSRESAPVTLYYDGHIGNRGQRDAIDANSRVMQQSGHGLWSINTGWAGGYANGSTGGYYMEYGIDTTSTSYSMLTLDGIKGRDFLSK